MKSIFSLLLLATALCLQAISCLEQGGHDIDSFVPTPTRSPSSVRGVLDFVNTTTATGWACDPNQPSQTLRVFFVLDGHIFAGSTFANQPRELQVGQMCGGNSDHGFVFQFPRPVVNILSNGRSHTIAAFVIPFPFGKPVQLSNSPQTIIAGSPSATPSSSPFSFPSVTPSRTPSPSVTPSRTPSPSITPSISPSNSITPSTTLPPSASPSPISTTRGFLDIANTTTAAGWACNPAFPNQNLTVIVLVDGFLFGGATVANLPREEAVGGMCGGNSAHGWSLEFQSSIVDVLSNGQAHNVSAFAVAFPSGVLVELSNSPITVQSGIFEPESPIVFKPWRPSRHDQK